MFVSVDVAVGDAHKDALEYSTEEWLNKLLFIHVSDCHSN
jgi:hypothetical protein